MKQTTLLFFIPALIVGALLMVGVKSAHAKTECTSTRTSADYGDSITCHYLDSVNDPNQAYNAFVFAKWESNGDRVSMAACLGNYPVLWTGPCVLIDNHDANSGGDTGYLSTGYINGSTPFKYWVVDFYAKDAYWFDINYGVYGRHVDVPIFSAPASVNINQPFTVDWSVVNSSDLNYISSAKLSWDGAVQNPGNDLIGQFGSYALTAGPSPGPAHIGIDATGPGCSVGVDPCIMTFHKDIYVDVIGSSVINVGCSIKDGTNGNPISGATCSMAGQSGVTNGSGYALTAQNISAGTYTLNVTASGYQNYSGDYNISGSTTINIDMTPVGSPPPGSPPTIYLDGPANGAAVSGSVGIAGWAIDNATANEGPIDHVNIKVDGALVNTIFGTGNTARPDVCAIWSRPGCPNVGYTYPWDSTTVSNGAHTVTATAVDSTGLTSSMSANITVNNVVAPGNLAPNITLDGPTNNSTVSGNVIIAGWAIDNATANEGPIDHVNIKVDGALVNTIFGTGNTARPDVCAIWSRPGCPNVGYTYPWDSTTVSNGAHTVTATAVDSTGLTSSMSANVTVNNIPLDTIPPVINPFDVQPRTIILGSSVTASFTATDSGGSHLRDAQLWRCLDSGCSWAQVDSTLTAPSNSDSWSSSWTDTPSAAGTYRYGIHVTDNAGNVGTEPAVILVTVNLPASLVNNAAFVSQSVPASMQVGTSTSVTVTMTNTGTTTWTSGAGYKLGSQNPQDNSTWGLGRVNLPNSVSPGQSVTFSFNITAPSSPGAYNFQWRMVQEGVEWFGNLSTNVAINVVAAPILTSNCDTSFPNNQFHVCFFDGTTPSSGATPVLSQSSGASLPSPVVAWAGFTDDWGTGQVDSSGKSDQVSATYRANINFQAGTYVFHASSDDGVNLGVNGLAGNILLNNGGTASWSDHGYTRFDSNPVTLPAGYRTVEMDWYENGGGAAVSLSWDFTPPLGPTASITANGSPGTVWVAYGSSPVISWNSSNTSFCQVRLGTNIDSGPIMWEGTSGAVGTTPPVTSDVVYRLACQQSNASAEVTVRPNAAPAPGTITFNVTYTATQGTLNVSCSPSPGGAGWTIAGVGHRSGPSSSDTVNAGSYAISFDGVSGYATPAGQTASVSAGGATNISCSYSALALNAPTSVSVDNSTCQRLTANWAYSDNGAANGFYVYRSTDDSNWGGAISGLLGIGSRSYTDNPPATNLRYYYRVSAHRTIGAVPQEAFSAPPDSSAMNLPCIANFGNSSKTISRVNGLAYSGSTIINNGDVITYQITLVNSGPAPGIVNYICDYPSANLTNLRNLAVSGSGSSSAGITANSPSCSGSFRLNISGNKDIPNNWIVTFDATLRTASSDLLEVMSNSAVINYTDGFGVNNHTVKAPNLIVNFPKSKPPNFREVAP